MCGLLRPREDELAERHVRCTINGVPQMISDTTVEQHRDSLTP